jgi:alkylhydroperoxidase family enzyme
MLRRLIERRLAAEENTLGAPLDYLRQIARVSLPAFFKFAAFTPLSRYRRKLPAAPYHVARLAAVSAEDCGTCLQIEINLARQSGVPREIVLAAIEQRPEALPPDLADAYHVARMVVEHGEDPDLRQRILDRHGEEGLVELALAVATCRVFPATKRGLGHAVSCSRMELDV